MDPSLAAHLELGALGDAEFVREAYRLVLRREPDAEGRARALTRLADGSLSRAALVAELAASDEFALLRALDDGVAEAAGARARGVPLREIQAPPGDERVIELPWVLSRVRAGERVLDAGIANALPAYIAALDAVGARELVGVDLAAAELPPVRTVQADLRHLPFEEGEFDVAVCISTLEHVGADNERYGAADDGDADGPRDALRELARVAGRVLVTVPTGAHEEHGWFVQLDPEEWRALFRANGLRCTDEEVYELRADGWRAASVDPSDGYRDSSASAVLCAELRPAGSLRRLLRR